MGRGVVNIQDLTDDANCYLSGPGCLQGILRPRIFHSNNYIMRS